MGHIVNSKSMRLGWVSNWCDHGFQNYNSTQNIYMLYIEYDFS